MLCVVFLSGGSEVCPVGCGASAALNAAFDQAEILKILGHTFLQDVTSLAIRGRPSTSSAWPFIYGCLKAPAPLNMRDTTRLEELARTAGANLSERCPPLQRPSSMPKFNGTSFLAEATSTLAQQRTSKAEYAAPSKRAKNVLRSKKAKEKLDTPSNWRFSLNERAAAVDAIVRSLGPVGLVEAVVEYYPGERLDVNFLQNAETATSKLKKPEPLQTLPSDWLECAARNNAIDFVRFFASRNTRQDALDRALGIALENSRKDIVCELLQYGANPNSQAECFMAGIESNDIDLTQLALGVQTSSSLRLHYLNSYLLQAVQNRSQDIVALLLAHGANPGYDNAAPILCATKANDLRMLSLLLVGSKNTISSEDLEIAIRQACQCSDGAKRLELLELLLCAGAAADVNVLQDELLGAVEDDRSDYVSLLVSHGVPVNRNESEGVRLAVRRLQFDCLVALLRGAILNLNATIAVDCIPPTASQDDALQILDMLFKRGARGGPWGRVLAEAVRQNQVSVVNELVKHGASLDWDDACAVRQALVKPHIPILSCLLQGHSSEHVLVKALPDAMRLAKKEERLDAVTMLLNKGVAGPELDLALRNAVSEKPGRQDHNLITCLLEHGASVDYEDRDGNCVHIACAQSNTNLLSLLCKFRPSASILSGAMPLVFSCRNGIGYSNAVSMMKLLLDHGAEGTILAETVLRAVREDEKLEILRLMLQKGGDVNYQMGLAIEEAVKARNSGPLEAICSFGRIDARSASRIIPLALAKTSYEPARASLLVVACKDYRDILTRALVDEVMHSTERREEVLEMLLKNGASIDHDSGVALSHAVHSYDANLLRVLLSRGPDQTSLTTAFRAAMSLEVSKRHAMMQMLLASAHQRAIGQDQALVMETNTLSKSGLDNVKLLLSHGASVDYLDGAAIQGAVTLRSSELLQLLLSRNPSKISLQNAFATARQISCSSQSRREIFQLLLQAGYRGDQINLALVESIERNANDTKIPRLLLNHDASVDYDRGHGLDLAARSGSLPLLELLMSKKPNPASLDRTFRTVMRTTFTDTIRISVYTSLLTGAVSVDLISAALHEAVVRGSVNLDLLRLLLSHKASLDFNDGEALCTLVRRGDISTTKILVTSRPARPGTLNKAFESCLTLETSKRLAFARLLMPLGVSISKVESSLNRIVKERDHEFLELMLKSGANPIHNEGEGLLEAAGMGDAVSFNLLAESSARIDIIDRAFARMLELGTIPKTPNGLQIAANLLTRGVSQNLIHQALQIALESYDKHSDQFVKMLLQYSVDVNTAHGNFFVLAGQLEDLTLFESLCAHNPLAEVVLPALIRCPALKDENKVVDLIRRCLDHIEGPFDSRNNSVLFLAMDHFPRGAQLVQLLLDHGCPAGKTQTGKLKPSCEAEPLTPLLKSLYDPRISDSVSLRLLHASDSGQ